MVAGAITSLFYIFADMKKIVHILAALIAAICLCGCIKDKITGADLTVGDHIPEFSVSMNDGVLVSDRSLIGDVSCIVFFHTSCPDCQQTLPVVQSIYDLYKPEGVRFALISREQPERDIVPFWEENGLNMPYSGQMDRAVYSKFASTRIPRVYICDKDGIIRYIFTDDPIPTYDDLMSSLESLIR